MNKAQDKILAGVEALKDFAASFGNDSFSQLVMEIVLEELMANPNLTTHYKEERSQEKIGNSNGE